MIQMELPFDDDISEELNVNSKQTDPALETSVRLDAKGHRLVHSYIEARDPFVTEQLRSTTRKVLKRVLSAFVSAADAFLSYEDMFGLGTEISAMFNDMDGHRKRQYIRDILQSHAGAYGYGLSYVSAPDGRKGYMLIDTIARRVSEYIKLDEPWMYGYAIYRSISEGITTADDMHALLTRDADDVSAVQQLAEDIAEGCLYDVKPCHRLMHSIAVEQKKEDEKYKINFEPSLDTDSQVGTPMPRTDKVPEYVRTDEALDKAEKVLESSSDDVDKPTHYQFPFQMQAPECGFFTAGMDFFSGNTFKYIWRTGRKGDWRKAVQDIDKAMKYMSMAAENSPEWWGSTAQREACVVWRTLVVEPERKGDTASELEYLRFHALSCIMRELDHHGREWYEAEDLKSLLLNMRALIVQNALSN